MWLLGGIVALVAGGLIAGILVRDIVRIVRAETAPAIATAPMAVKQTIRLSKAGTIGVYAWTKRASADFARCRLEMQGASDGAPVPGSRSWLRENNATLGWRHRVKLAVFDVPEPGDYELNVEGLKPKPGDETELWLCPAQTDGATIRALAPRIVGLVFAVLAGIGGFVVGLVVPK